MSKNWIQGAIKRPGALRAVAKRKGLIKGDAKLSSHALSTLKKTAKKTGNKRLSREVGLADTLKHLR